MNNFPNSAEKAFYGIKDFLWARRIFILVVIIPTMMVAAYYYLVASDQYQSEAHFIIRTADQGTASTSGLGLVLGLAGGSAQSQGEAMSVADYLQSHDAVGTLRKSGDLVARFRRPEADPLSRLNTDQPTPERLLKYYRTKVDVTTDRDSGITTLKVRAFRSADAYDLIQRLQALGEERVNTLNQRGYQNAISEAQKEYAAAEISIADIQSRMTEFRQGKGDIDPQGSGAAQIRLISELEGNLASARAQLSTVGALVDHSSPQYIALYRHVKSIESQVNSQSNRTAGGISATASDLGTYEDLRLKQEFAGKFYESAAANLEKAREQAQKQQLYLVRIVEANRPVKALFPERARIVFTVFVGLLLAYSIGWLIAAGVREHAA
jgi:capsular polysaccharide transport system permease protein